MCNVLLCLKEIEMEIPVYSTQAKRTKIINTVQVNSQIKRNSRYYLYIFIRNTSLNDSFLVFEKMHVVLITVGLFYKKVHQV